MATYHSRTYDTLGRRLIDAAIGAVLGTVVAIVLWIVTVWCVMG